jgi:hypothetical protein
VLNEKKHSGKPRANQGPQQLVRNPIKSRVLLHSTLTARILPLMAGYSRWPPCWRSWSSKKLVEEMLTVKRRPRFMSVYQFVMAMVLAIYVGFSRLNHLRFVANDPMLTGLLKVASLPGQSTFWRFCPALHLTVARQLLELQQVLRQRVWEAANLPLPAITVDTDTTVHTLHGNQMGARKSYNPKNRGKKSYQPILTFIAETREYIWGELRNGDRPDGKQIARHLTAVFAALPTCVDRLFARLIPGSIVGRRCRPTSTPKRSSSCWPARRLACWINCKRLRGSPRRRPTPTSSVNSATNRKAGAKPTALSPCAISYKNDKPSIQRAQYQLLDTPQYLYRVFVTNMNHEIAHLEWFYNQRAAAENLIKEANNDAGLAAHPSQRWATNCVHFQLVMLAYNLNCWLLLFNREEEIETDNLKHTTLATARLRFLLVAAKIWRHSGRVGISYSDQYQEKGLLQRLMDRLRVITVGPTGFLPVVATPLAG